MFRAEDGLGSLHVLIVSGPGYREKAGAKVLTTKSTKVHEGNSALGVLGEPWCPSWFPALIQAFLPPQISEGADVGQAEGEAEQILVTHIGDGVAAIFESYSAAIPVVGGLCSGELQRFCSRIEAEAAGGAESAVGKPAIAQGHAELLILEGSGVGLRNLQKGVPAADGERPDIVVDEKRALVDASELEVVVEVPFRIGVAAGGSSQPRYQGRKMPRLSRECDAGQLFRRREHVALSSD